MDTTISENQKNVAAIVHLSTFSKFFIPFGNFLAPLILWTLNKENEFVDDHGKQAINFQLSILLYSIFIGLICLPFVIIFAPDFVSLVDTIDHHVDRISVHEIKNLSGYFVIFLLAALLLFGLFVFELYCVISATMNAAKGRFYKYPLSIKFIRTNSLDESETENSDQEEENQSENEHIS
jgi:uncharacterized Tic20 family protein